MLADRVRYSSARHLTQRTRTCAWLVSHRCTRSQAWQTITDCGRWIMPVRIIRPSLPRHSVRIAAVPWASPCKLSGSMRSSIPGIVLSLAVALCAIPWAHAADPQSYRVDIASTGDASIDSTLRASSELVSLRETAPISPFGLIARARGEVDRLKTVLESYGFYQSAVTIKIDGLGLNSKGVVEALTGLAKGQDARVSVTFDLGPLYHLRNVSIDGTVPEAAAAAFSLRSGAPAVAADVLAAGARLLSSLQEQGYAFAKVDPPVAYEDQTLPLLDVSFHVDPGARVRIGEIRLEGLGRVHEKLVRRQLTIHPGQQYSSTAIEAARRDL